MNTLRWIRNIRSRHAFRQRRFRGDEGGALVELAIALPLIMTLLTGAASFSLALYSYEQLGNAVSSATQLLGEEQGITTDPCNTAMTAVTAALPNWTASNFTYTVTITNSSGTATSYPSGSTYGSGSKFSCTAGAANMAANEPVTLTVSYAYSWFPILDFSPSSPIAASESALME